MSYNRLYRCLFSLPLVSYLYSYTTGLAIRSQICPVSSTSMSWPLVFSSPIFSILSAPIHKDLSDWTWWQDDLLFWRCLDSVVRWNLQLHHTATIGWHVDDGSMHHPWWHGSTISPSIGSRRRAMLPSTPYHLIVAPWRLHTTAADQHSAMQ